MQFVPEAEIAKQRERITQLYQSHWMVDNLSAHLMDTQHGALGFHEAVARANHLRTHSREGGRVAA